MGAGCVEVDLATDAALTRAAAGATSRASDRRRFRTPPAAPADAASHALRDAVSAHPKPDATLRAPRFSTISDMEIAPLYGPDDLPDAATIGRPGEFPYTRG